MTKKLKYLGTTDRFEDPTTDTTWERGEAHDVPDAEVQRLLEYPGTEWEQVDERATGLTEETRGTEPKTELPRPAAGDEPKGRGEHVEVRK